MFQRVFTIFLYILQIAFGSEFNPIVGGRVVTPKDKYPFVVSIAIPSKKEFNCAGSIISKNAILTAAHCITPNTKEIILVGAYNLLADEPNRQEFTIRSQHTHPSFDSMVVNPHEGDIGIIILNESIDTTKFPHIPLDIETTALTGIQATVIGWGATLQDGVNGKEALREVDVPVVSNEVCNNAYEGRVNDKMFCAGFQVGGYDSCKGDSGGPIFYKKNGEYKQIGIVSWGEGCARAHYYGVYTRINQYAGFIINTLLNNPPGEPKDENCECVNTAEAGDACGKWGNSYNWCFAKGGGQCRKATYSEFYKKWYVRNCSPDVAKKPPPFAPYFRNAGSETLDDTGNPAVIAGASVGVLTTLVGVVGLVYNLKMKGISSKDDFEDFKVASGTS